MTSLEELYLDFGIENGGYSDLKIEKGFYQDVCQSTNIAKLYFLMRE